MNEEIKERLAELHSLFENKSYRHEIIRRALNESSKLRKTFAAVLILAPCRIGEILEKTLSTKSSTYTQLYSLIDYGLVQKVAIMDLWNRPEKSLKPDELEILKKFRSWTKTMAPGQMRNFAAKTNFWTLTEEGLNPQLVDWIIKLEKEQKKGAN